MSTAHRTAPPSWRPASVARALLVSCVFTAVACASLAQQKPMRDEVTFRGITKGEFALLPDWCYDSQGGPYGSPEGAEMLNRSPRARHWVAAMGTDFWHVHHYCWALRDMYRVEQPGVTERERGFLLARAVSDLVYMIVNCQRSFVLMPEIHLKLGIVYLKQGNRDGAIRQFEESRRLKPDYWPAYVEWADFLVSLKLWDQARELLEEGLRNAPGSVEIRERLENVNRHRRGTVASDAGHNKSK